LPGELSNSSVNAPATCISRPQEKSHRTRRLKKRAVQLRARATQAQTDGSSMRAIARTGTRWARPHRFPDGRAVPASMTPWTERDDAPRTLHRCKSRDSRSVEPTGGQTGPTPWVDSSAGERVGRVQSASTRRRQRGQRVSARQASPPANGAWSRVVLDEMTLRALDSLTRVPDPRGAQRQQRHGIGFDSAADGLDSRPQSWLGKGAETRLCGAEFSRCYSPLLITKMLADSISQPTARDLVRRWTRSQNGLAWIESFTTTPIIPQFISCIRAEPSTAKAGDRARYVKLDSRGAAGNRATRASD